jgi:quercetin dioxygenase-like cupin family protein
MKIIRGADLPLVPASHEDQLRPGVLKRVLAVKGELFEGQVQMINWAVLPGESAFQPHYHQDMEEIFIIIRGEVEVRIGAQSDRLQRGDAVIVSPTEVHQMKNLSPEDAEYIVVGISGAKNGKTVLI